MPKADFPRFEGKDPRELIKKCDNFFMLNPMVDQTSKVLYAALYMEGEADTWYQALEEQIPWINWDEFVGQVCHRFGKGGHENLTGQFNKLVQKGRST